MIIDGATIFRPYTIGVETEEEHKMLMEVLGYFYNNNVTENRLKPVSRLMDCIGQIQQGAKHAEWYL